MSISVLVDRASLNQFRLLTLARGRTYYTSEPPVLGIVVVRTGHRLEELVGLVLECASGHEKGVEGWCVAGYEGQKHGKLTIFSILDQQHYSMTMSGIFERWRREYQM